MDKSKAYRIMYEVNNGKSINDFPPEDRNDVMKMSHDMCDNKALMDEYAMYLRRGREYPIIGKDLSQALYETYIILGDGIYEPEESSSRLGVTKATVSRRLDKLEERRYIKIDRTNVRKKVITLLK